MSGAFAFDVPLAWLTVPALVALGALYVAWGIRRLTTLRRANERRVLIALRVATAVLASLVAIQPSWSHEDADEHPGTLVVLVDHSRSMTVRSTSGRRIDRARALVDRWRRSAESSATFFSFGRELHPLGDSASLESGFADDTDLGEAVRRAAEAAGDVGAVVIVSDGADRRAGLVEQIRARGVRVHAVAAEDDDAWIDDAIERVDYDRVAFARRPLRVSAHVRSSGRGAGVLRVALAEGSNLVAETFVTLDDDGRGLAEFEVASAATLAGRTLYRVVLPVDERDRVPENNETSLLVSIVRDNLRALLVAGQPSWDQRFMRAFLKRDPTHDLISFFILRSNADMTMADSSDLALIPFPVDELFSEHLGSFDLVVLQNFEYGPYDMAVYLPRLREYVERGGALAFLGGPLSFSHAGYAETELAEVLPVLPLPRGTPDSQALDDGRFSPRVADDAERHPLVGFGRGRAERSLLASLPPLLGVNRVASIHRDAQALLVHPTLRLADGSPHPLLAVQGFGRGRVLALTTDTIYRWGFTAGGETGDRGAYDRFWDTAIRWLTRDPALEPARLEISHDSFGPEAAIEVRASLADVRYRPLAARPITMAIRIPGQPFLIERSTRTDEEGRATVTLPAPAAPGGYELVALADGAVLATRPLLVEGGGRELADPRPDAALLRALAEATEGSFHTIDDAPELAAFDSSRIERRGITTARPFASGWMVSLLLVLFGAEWFARRRWGAE